MPTFADRMNVIKPSATVAVSNKVREMKAAGEDVISFSIGVPGFLPPDHVYKAAHAAIDADKGTYLPGRGTPELLAAFQKRLQEDGFDYADNELCVALGGKNALFNLMQVLAGPGDEVLFPAPFWTSYPDIVALAGATPKWINCSAADSYKLTATRLAETITSKTKAFIFNNPSNPTGMVYSSEEVKALADVLANHPNVWILSDDIYDKMIYDGEVFHSLLTARPELRDRFIIMQSISKTYGMPGWRVGMVAAPEGVMKPLLTFVGQALMNVPGVAMAAAAAAFGGDHSFLPPLKKEFEQKRNMVMEVLTGLDGIACPRPTGAFYAFPDVSALYGKTSARGAKIDDDIAFCTAILEEQKLALVPGSGFGAPQAVRISYATDLKTLEKGLQRFADFVHTLR
jgi:aspartate aminotransferase